MSSFAYTLVLFVPFASMANEGFMQSQSGGMRPVSGKTSIAMESEVVRIVFEKESYVVDGKYSFSNSGEETTITMGFPISSGGVLFREGLSTNQSLIEGPKTWVDGTEVPFTRTSSSLDYDDKEGNKILTSEKEIAAFKESVPRLRAEGSITAVREKAWYTKEVHFAANGRLTTRVRYKAHYGESSSDSFLFAVYIYGSGGTWNGRIQKAAFILQVSSEIWLTEFPDVDYPHQWSRNSEYGYTLTLSDFRPEDKDELVFPLSRRYPPYAAIFGILEAPITERELSLCSRKQLEAFKGYGGADFADVVKQYSAMVDEYAKKVAAQNFQYVIGR